MPRIIGKILDSAGRPITCKLAVALSDLLIFTAPQANELRLTAPSVFDIPEGYLDVELVESATQRTTYDFHIYTALISTFYYELDGTPYTGPTHEEEGTSYTGSAPTASRLELFKETLEGQETLTRFNAIVPIGVTVQFSSLVGQGVTSRRFVDRGYYREIIASLPGVGESINQNAYARYSELAAVRQLVEALETQQIALSAGVGAGGSGGGAVRKPFASTLSFDKAITAYDQKTVTGPLTFSVMAGLPLVPGATAIVRLIADGSNTPIFSAFKLAIGSAEYDTRAGYLNVLNFWYDGVEFWVSILQQVGAIAAPVFDTTPPVLQSASVNASDAAKVDLVYSELLSAVNVPAPSAYTATGRTVTAVTVVNNIITLTLSAAVAPSTSITVAYTPPGTEKVQDQAGNFAASFTQSVSRGGVADTTPPVLQTVTLDGTTFNKIYLGYSELLSTANVPAIAAFTVTNKTVSSVTISGQVVTVILSTALSPSESVTVTYVPPTANKIQDLSGNPAAGASQAVTRPAASDTTAPVLLNIAFNANDYSQIILTYNETLAAGSIPSPSAFGVTGKTVSAVGVSGATVTVTLTAVFGEGESATITYAPPSSGKIQDAAGNAAIAISQTISRAPASLDADFRLGSMPAGFSTVNLTSSIFTAAGLQITAPSAGNWGNGLVLGPIWDTSRTLSIYMVSAPTTGNNYGGGISAQPINWLTRSGNPDSLIGIRASFFFNSADIKQFTAPGLSTRIRYDFSKEGNDIRMKVFIWNGSAFVLATNGEFLGVGIAPGLANSKIFVDAFKNTTTVERVVN